MLGAYRRVLANRALSRLLLGEFISSVGDWLYLVALLIIVYDRTQDAVLLGVVGAARILPYLVLSVPAGIVADRFDRRLVLLSTDLARAVVMVALAVVVYANGPIEVIVALTILATCFSSFFGPAIGAYMPSLVHDEADLGPANTTYATLENAAYIIGPALAAIIIGISNQIFTEGDRGLAVAFLLNAISFVVVAAVLWRLPPSRAKPGQKGALGAEAATAEPAPTEGVAHGAPSGPEAPAQGVKGLRGVLVPLTALVVTDSAASIVFGGLSVLSVVIAFDVLRSGEEATGALNAAAGVGGVIGALISGALVLRRRLAPPLLLGAGVLGVSVAVLGQSGSLVLAMLAMAGATIGALLMSIVATTMFQRIVPDEVRGRAVGVIETVSILCFAIGSLALPALVETNGIGPVLLGSGIGLAVIAVVSVPFLGHWAVQVPPMDEVRAQLSKVPLFAGLSPAALETAERRAHVVTAEPGDVVIRQGDEADRFYVIVDGEVEVTQRDPDGGPPRVLRRMVPKDVFGEIGLLSEVPRTATVTAASRLTLLALDKPDFLALVESSPGLTFPVMDAHRGVTASG
jgi:MFS family permease